MKIIFEGANALSKLAQEGKDKILNTAKSMPDSFEKSVQKTTNPQTIEKALTTSEAEFKSKIQKLLGVDDFKLPQGVEDLSYKDMFEFFKDIDISNVSSKQVTEFFSKKENYVLTRILNDLAPWLYDFDSKCGFSVKFDKIFNLVHSLRASKVDTLLERTYKVIEEVRKETIFRSEYLDHYTFRINNIFSVDKFNPKALKETCEDFLTFNTFANNPKYKEFFDQINYSPNKFLEKGAIYSNPQNTKQLFDLLSTKYHSLQGIMDENLIVKILDKELPHEKFLDFLYNEIKDWPEFYTHFMNRTFGKEKASFPYEFTLYKNKNNGIQLVIEPKLGKEQQTRKQIMIYDLDKNFNKISKKIYFLDSSNMTKHWEDIEKREGIKKGIFEDYQNNTVTEFTEKEGTNTYFSTYKVCPTRFEKTHQMKTTAVDGVYKDINIGQKPTTKAYIKNGAKVVSQDLTSPNNARLRNESFTYPNGDTIKHLQIFDANGKKLIDDTRTIEFLDDGSVITSKTFNGTVKTYKTTVKPDNKGLIIEEKGTGKIVELNSSDFADFDFSFSELAKKINGEELIEFKGRITSIKKVAKLKDGCAPDAFHFSEQGKFVYEHEVGHFLDQLKKIADDKELQKIYDKELQKLKQATTIEKDLIEYFIKDKSKSNGIALNEIIAEANGISTIGYGLSAPRTQILMKYFPETIAKAAILLNK